MWTVVAIIGLLLLLWQALDRHRGIDGFLRKIPIVIVVVVFLPLLMMTVIGFADLSVGSRPGPALAFAAVLIPIWVIWFAAVAWIIRTAGKSNRTPLLMQDPKKPDSSNDQ